MPLGREVCLGPVDIMLDGDPAPRLPKGIAPHNFRPTSIVAKRSPISATVHCALDSNATGNRTKTSVKSKLL